MHVTRASVAALIPAFREEKHIRGVVLGVLKELDTVLVVDDGSPDETSKEAQAAGAQVLKHEINQGKGAAIKSGLRHFSELENITHILVLDGDGQHLPEEISRFLETANRTEAAMVVGNRMGDLKAMPLARRLTNLYMSQTISGVIGQKVPDTQCGFRMFRKDIANAFLNCRSSRYDFETEMLAVVARQGIQIATCPVSTIYGTESSKIHPMRDALRFFKLLGRLKKEARGREVGAALA